MRIAILGAGLLGRLTALALAERGDFVSLYDIDPSGKSSCAHAAAGMLAPFCEWVQSSTLVRDLGLASLKLWPLLSSHFSDRGTLVVSHAQDLSERDRFRQTLLSKGILESQMTLLDRSQVAEIEPELASRFSEGLLFRHEAHLDTRATLDELSDRLAGLRVNIQPVSHFDHAAAGIDRIIDTRGLGAKSELRSLRGVRGELLYLHAPEVSLSRPVRVLHPRYAIYIVPRAGSIFVVGSTSLETEDLKPVGVRSMLELLSAASVIHPGFMHASIIESVVGIRPAMPDHEPRITTEGKLIRANGLYRHGFLVGPALAQALSQIAHREELPCELSSMVSHTN